MKVINTKLLLNLVKLQLHTHVRSSSLQPIGTKDYNIDDTIKYTNLLYDKLYDIIRFAIINRM